MLSAKLSYQSAGHSNYTTYFIVHLLVNFEVKQMTGPFRGSLLNSTVSLNDCDGKGGVGFIS
jgi:hypothetical protein